MPICPFIGLSVYRRRPVPICPFIGLSVYRRRPVPICPFIGLSAQAGKNRPCHHAVYMYTKYIYKYLLQTVTICVDLCLRGRPAVYAFILGAIIGDRFVHESIELISSKTVYIPCSNIGNRYRQTDTLIFEHAKVIRHIAPSSQNIIQLWMDMCFQMCMS